MGTGVGVAVGAGVGVAVGVGVGVITGVGFGVGAGTGATWVLAKTTFDASCWPKVEDVLT